MIDRKALNEKILRTQEELTQNENRLKRLLQKQTSTERKARTRRLIERGAILESFFDGAEFLSNEQVKAILTVAFHTEVIAKLLTTARANARGSAMPEPENAEAEVP